MANDKIPPPPTLTITGKEITVPSTSTDPSKVNVSNPYFTHHSDHPGLVLISKPLNGDNYSTWKRAMTLALNSKNKLGFVNGSIKAPSEETDPEGYATWSRCNDMVHSWIVNTLNPDISDSVIYYSTAHEVWEDLHIAYRRQEQLPISTYYTKMKRLWDELASYNDATHGAQQDQQKLMQFLMGLNDSSSAIHGQILLMNPLPSVRQAYSSVSQEEKQRLLSTTSAASDSGSSAAMAVRNNNSGNKSTLIQSERFDRPYGGGHQDKCHSGSGRRRPQCSHYGEMGHWVQTCYELHGYPAGHPKAKHNSDPKRFNNSNKPAVNHVSETLSKVDGNQVVGISEAQLQQLLSLLDNKNEGSSSQANAVTKPGSGYDEDDWFG
ncbi:hypothetical protein ACOSP7_004359 [Xanthoceras sorbifolium]